MTKKAETVLRNDRGQIVTVADRRDLVLRYLKHHAPDGDYTVDGPGIDAVFYRMGGVVYPAAGVIDGVELTPRSREECRAYYEGSEDARDKS
jgi:hypothetical protein